MNPSYIAIETTAEIDASILFQGTVWQETLLFI